jgi:hypothetical protein
VAMDAARAARYDPIELSEIGWHYTYQLNDLAELDLTEHQMAVLTARATVWFLVGIDVERERRRNSVDGRSDGV